MDLCGGIAFKGGVKTAVVVIIPEQFEFSLQINGVPEAHLVKKLTTNGTDNSIDA